LGYSGDPRNPFDDEKRGMTMAGSKKDWAQKAAEKFMADGRPIGHYPRLKTKYRTRGDLLPLFAVFTKKLQRRHEGKEHGGLIMGVDTHKVEIVPVVLELHPDADRLSLVKVYNFTCVVNTADWLGVEKLHTYSRTPSCLTHRSTAS